jgi:two-component system sensor histidine kinase KdpD
MLEAARRREAEGVDVVVGWSRRTGAARPRRCSRASRCCRGAVRSTAAQLEEFDLDAALARRPGLLLVDELAHTNAPGSRHPSAGRTCSSCWTPASHVHTTLNVQHLESLNDVVAQITWVRVRETVPDAVLERADEVELVDLPPDALLERLREGKVYLPEQAQRPRRVLQRGNLLALRELALRRMAQRVDSDVLAYRREHGIATTWPAAERILVRHRAEPVGARLVRAAAAWPRGCARVGGGVRRDAGPGDRGEATAAASASTSAGRVAGRRGRDA